MNVTREEKLILGSQINAWDSPVSEYVEASTAVHEQLQTQETDFHGDGIFKPMPRWQKCKKCAQELFRNTDTSV